MNPALVAAWLAGEAIVGWRVVHREHRLPAPGELLGITALFVGGALVADVFPKAAGLVVITLAGLDVAALLNVLPLGLGGQIAAAEAAQGGSGGQATGTTQAPGTSTAGGRG